MVRSPTSFAGSACHSLLFPQSTYCSQFTSPLLSFYEDQLDQGRGELAQLAENKTLAPVRIVRLNADHGGPPRPRQGLARKEFFTTRQRIRWGPTPGIAGGRRWRNNRLMRRAGLGSRARSRNGTAIISRLRVVSFRMAEVMAGCWRKNGEAAFRLAPRGKGNAMQPRLSEREQAPALHSGSNPQSPAHFGVRRLAAALSPRELAVTSERRSLLVRVYRARAVT
jgi:hypothetical protein